MSRIPGHRLLHAPGPTHVPDAVLDAMHRQPLDLGDPRLTDIIDDCERGIARLLQSEHAKVIMYAANGHGAWEAAIDNLLAPDATVLIPGTGHFSESWSIQTEAMGRQVQRIEWRQGFAIDPEQIAQALLDDKDREIAAVFVVHTDTASGVSNDLAAIRKAMTRVDHPALLVVDVVASLAAAPFDMHALGINVVVGASQKGLMVPPGLSFVAIDPRAMAVARANPAPRFYWDWSRRDSDFCYRKFCGTPPQTMLMGLQASLKLLADEGIDAVHARHALHASAVHAAVKCWSSEGALDFFGQADCRSVSVTTIKTVDGIDPEAIRTVARERFQVAVAGGLGQLTGRVFRIGHLGDLNAAMLLGCLAGVEAAMRVIQVPHGANGVTAALEVLAAD